MNASRKYYVSTVVRYVLVDAANEAEARAKGEAELNAQYDAEGFKGTRGIHTVRLATEEEIELQKFHDRMTNG